MNTFRKILILIAGGALALSAQTATPSTTLCAAQSKTANTVCLTSTAGVTNQTGIYVDQEYELVQLSGSQAVCTGPCNVPVSRSNRNAGSGPTAHLNASRAWVALTPSNSVVPGLNGFELGTNVTLIGACTRTSFTYLPVIFVNRGIKRDCVNGVAVDYAPLAGLDYPSPTPQSALTTNGALTVGSGNYIITKAGVLAMTLAAPTAGTMDGVTITLRSATANAHTLTATTLLQNGASGSPYTTATFGAYLGATITLRAYNGTWYIVSSSNVTLS